MQVAETILQQLGGRRFIAMTGASMFVGDERALTFKIGAGATNRANRVRITLDASDTYSVEFFRIRGVDVKKVGEHEGIYADALREVFTRATGMHTSL